jgi:hypothetical protein
MAVIVPPRYDDRTSGAERRIFELLRTDPGTDGWIVLHSLALTHRARKPYGEIDFVALVPEGGIVCLEVKGGRISCRDGIWRTRDRHDHEAELTRSPFQQALDGMFALRDAVRSHFVAPDPLNRVLVASAVVLPDVHSPPPTTEFEDWECIDIRRLREPISRAILEVIRHQRIRVGPGATRPDAAAIRSLRTFLRPNFDVVVARSTTIARSEERLIRLTEEQYEVIDSLERNERCIVEGAAGTGKTLLALEYTRRAAAAGKKSLLLCFNRTLGEWLTEQCASSGISHLVMAGSFHRCLRSVILQSSYRDEFLWHEAGDSPPSLFTESYPVFGELAVSELADLPEFLIVDEAQDLAREECLTVLNAWLRGGLAGGRWVMLGDFTRQAIYSATRVAFADHPELQEATPAEGKAGPNEESRTTHGLLQLLRSYDPHAATLVLRRNCRNTRPIGEETALLSGFDSLPYRLDGHDSLPVDYRWWRSADSEVEELRGVLGSLTADGVAVDDIVILSPQRYESSVASRLASDPEHPVVPSGRRASSASGGAPVAFCTIHAFKGMESPVVVMCDIARMSGEEAQTMLYVGMSRARSHLIVLLNERLRRELRVAVERRLTREWAS